MGGKTVVLGLSGGVDSAVAARLLQEQGYTVYGHWLDIGLGGREDAQQVAETFGIPFSAGDIRRELEASVMGPFQRDYLAGRTPLPCARCNPTVKFPALFRRAEEVGADWVATGHYARIAAGPAGEPLLCRGAHTNDQAYMLARLPQHWLSRLVFPIGGYEKTQVRQLARDFGLPVAEKPDSMEICFIPDGDYAAWLEARGAVPPPGHFVDRTGRVLGRHQGLERYTTGQRRGLGVSGGRPLYVVRKDLAANTVILGDEADLYARTVWAEDFRWVSLPPQETPLAVTAKTRYSQGETAATLYPEGEGRVRVVFDAPQRAVTPGQSLAAYAGDAVVGGGVISRAE